MRDADQTVVIADEKVFALGANHFYHASARELNPPVVRVPSDCGDPHRLGKHSASKALRLERREGEFRDELANLRGESHL